MSKLGKAAGVFVLLISVTSTFADHHEGAAAPVNCTAGDPILVTGGGIVKKGERVSLTLCAGNEEMDKCYFSNKDGKNKCSFKTNNNETSKSCKGDFGAGAGLEAEITADHCTVTIASMSEVFAGEVELDLDMAEKVATLSLQRDIEAMELGFRDTHLRENVSATVQCNITGGFPAPEVTFMLMSDANATVENSSKRFSNMTQRTDNGSTTFVTASFTPQQGDQGSFPCCRAEQFDLATERRSLLVINKMLNKSIDVEFPVRFPVPDQKVDHPDERTVVVRVLGNPAPTYTWTVDSACEDDLSRGTPTGHQSDCHAHHHNITAGEKIHNGSMVASNITKVANTSFLYEASLSIVTHDDWMHGMNVSLTVFNGVGEAVKVDRIEFTIPTTTAAPATTQPPAITEPTPSQGAGGQSAGGQGGGEAEAGTNTTGLAVVLLLCVLLGLGTGLYCYRKRAAATSERLPLSGSSMNSLSSR